MYVALHGVNIPGGIWLDEAKVRAVLHRLPPSMTFFRIVGRPDSILLVVDSTTTEEDTRRAVNVAVGSSGSRSSRWGWIRTACSRAPASR